MMAIKVIIPIDGNEIFNTLPQCGEHVSHVLRSARDRVRDRLARHIQRMRTKITATKMFTILMTE